MPTVDRGEQEEEEEEEALVEVQVWGAIRELERPPPSFLSPRLAMAPLRTMGPGLRNHGVARRPLLRPS